MAGDYFGEVALTTAKTRSATVIALEDLHCVSLDKGNYRDVFRATLKRMNQKVEMFEKNLPRASRDAVSSFSYNFRDTRYSKGEYLWREGDPATFFFLIQDGYVELSQALSGYDDSNKTTEETGHQPLSNRSHKKQVKRCTLCIVGPDSMVGEEDFYFAA